jgi:hypothetical protein
MNDEKIEKSIGDSDDGEDGAPKQADDDELPSTKRMDEAERAGKSRRKD